MKEKAIREYNSMTRKERFRVMHDYYLRNQCTVRQLARYFHISVGTAHKITSGKI